MKKHVLQMVSAALGCVARGCGLVGRHLEEWAADRQARIKRWSARMKARIDAWEAAV